MLLPEDIQFLLNGKALDQKQHLVMMLQSVSEEGYPHTAMISVGEIVATSATNVRLALWTGTQTTNSLEAVGKANLVIVHNQKVTYIELACSLLAQAEKHESKLTFFVADVKAVKEDSAKYADILSGITMQLHHPTDVIERWQTTIKNLLAT